MSLSLTGQTEVEVEVEVEVKVEVKKKHFKHNTEKVSHSLITMKDLKIFYLYKILRYR